MLERLDAIELGLSNTPIPNAYSDYAYNLRTHLDIVRGRILRLGRRGDGTPEGSEAPAPANAPR